MHLGSIISIAHVSAYLDQAIYTLSMECERIVCIAHGDGLRLAIVLISDGPRLIISPFSHTDRQGTYRCTGEAQGCLDLFTLHHDHLFWLGQPRSGPLPINIHLERRCRVQTARTSVPISDSKQSCREFALVAGARR